MARKDRDRSVSSSGSSDDSRSSSAASDSKKQSRRKRDNSRISSSKHKSRKSRKSYKNRDDKKKKRRRSSSSRGSESSSLSRSRSASKNRTKNKQKEKSRTKSRERRAQREKEKAKEVEKKPEKTSPENKGPEKSEEEIQREKERKKQIRLAKIRAMKYEKEEEPAVTESPRFGPSNPEPAEVEEEFKGKNFGLVDALELDDDDKLSRQDKETPRREEPANKIELEDDEIDPLDAYMSEINQVAKKQVQDSWHQNVQEAGMDVLEPKVDPKNVMTADDFEKLFKQPVRNGHSARNDELEEGDDDFPKPKSHIEEEEDNEPLDDEQEEAFHRAFIEEMKRKKLEEEQKKAREIEEEKPKKKNYEEKEIMDDDYQGEYMAFRENTEEDLDYVAKERRRAEKKELKADSNYEYLPFRKHFYIEPREIADMTKEEVDEYRKELGDIQVRGRDCPKPIKDWYQCGLSDALLELITQKKKFPAPFPIQCQSIPAIMSGRDVIGVAETGSGKTLAYVLPMIRHIKDQRPLQEGDGPIGLILAPTRELAWQIFVETKTFAKAVGLNVACVYGGAGVQGQIADLKRGTEIVVCTPGRMIDVLTTSNGKITNLRRVTFVVLDEADRMLDFGFEPQIGRILSNVREDKQSVMFSATFPRNVEALAKKVLNRPVEIIVGSRGKISANIDQIIEVVNEDDKFLRLLKYLGEWSDKGSIIIFVNKQNDADQLFKDLIKYSYYALVLHGGQDADDREGTISDFKKGVRTLMVATSVCARGLDIKSLNLVVNYDCPHHKEDYVHRIGRTGRAGNKGTAVTFITPEEDQYAFDLITALNMSNITPPKDLVDLANDYRDKVERGEAKYYANKNLTGTGFKFDKTEQDKISDAKKAIKRQYGLNFGGESEDLSDEEIVTSAEDKNNKDNDIDEVQMKKMLKDQNTKVAVTRAAEKAAKDAILAGANSEEVLRAAHNAIKSVLGQFKGTGIEQAVKVIGQIEEREDESNERVSADLEINDYPQSARNKVTQKDFLGMLHDLTNCSVSVRGLYYEPTKKVPPGHKKLRLHIIGENKSEVESAYREIRRILDETAALQANTVGAHTGKFTI